ncbi:MAG: DUF309 domain-containing protein [Brevefilum sp.]
MSETQTQIPPSFYEGIRLFNQQDFYEAHEYFEDAWRQTFGDEREFFRALLQLSGGFYRLTQNRPEAARKFFAHAHKWLALYPDNFHGFDIAQIRAYTDQLIKTIDEKTPPDEILQEQFQPMQPLDGPHQ